MTKTFDLGSIVGQDGVSPIITGSKVGKTTTLTIIDANNPSPGATLATIQDGADGSADIPATNELLKGDGAGSVAAATAGTDYQTPLTSGTDYIAPPSSPTSGDVLTWDGNNWEAAAPADGLPSQTGKNGKFLTTNGTTASWDDTPSEIPSQTGQNGKFLTTNGTSVSWGTPSAPSVATTSGMLKGDNNGNAIAATAGTDYQAPLVAGTDYQTPLAEEEKVWYGYCETAASTATKTVTITGITALTEGLNVRIGFKYGYSSNSTPQLKINSLDAKNINYDSYTAPLSNAWAAGAVLDLLYDGTQFKIVGQARADTSLYGIVKLSDSTSSSSSQIAATSKAVKSAYDLADAAIPAPNNASQGDYLKYDGNGWVAGAGGGGGGGSIPTTSAMLKGDNAGGAAAAVAGTDYIAPPGSPSSGDVLTYSGTAWGAAAVPKEIYWCTYGTTTNSQIETALSAGQTPCCIYSSKLYVYAYKSSTTSHNFVCNYGDTQYQIKNNNGAWSTTNYTWQKQITASGLLKGAGSGTVSAATAGTDYQAPLTAGTDYIAPPASPSSGDVLTWSGSAWAASAVPTEIPTQTGNTGKFLTTNGTSVSWASVGGGTVTSVGVTNAADGGLTISGTPVTSSGNITVGHTNVLTNAQTTQAVYPIKIDKNGHISEYGSAVSIPSVASTSSLLKGNGSGGAVAATAGTDYATPTNITDKINRTTDVDVADTNYSTFMARGESLNSSDTTPTVNGTIAWKYE